MKLLISQIRKLYNLGIKHGGYFVTTFLNTSIPLLLLPILTRFLSPAEYANIAIFRFYHLITNSLSGTSIPIVISKNFYDKPKEYIAKIIGNSLRVVFFFTLTVSVIVLLFSETLQNLIGLPLLWILIVPWSSFFFIVFNIGLTVMRNQKKVLIFSFHKLGNTLINLLLSLALVTLLLWGWQGRVWGIIISLFISAIWALYYLHSQQYLSLVYSKEQIRKTLKIILPLIPNSLQSVIISQIGIFFMQYYFTKELLGVYSVGFQIAYTMKLLFNTASFSWAPFIYEQLSRKEKANKVVITQYYYLLAGLLLLGVLFLVLFKDILLKIFTAAEYHQASEFIPWFAIGFMFHGLYVFLMPFLMKSEKQKQVSILSFFNVFVMLGSYFIFIHFFGYMGIAYSFVFTYFTMFISLFWLTQKSYPLPWISCLLKINS